MRAGWRAFRGETRIRRCQKRRVAGVMMEVAEDGATTLKSGATTLRAVLIVWARPRPLPFGAPLDALDRHAGRGVVGTFTIL